MVEEQGCSRLILNFDAKEPICLYSVLLAGLVKLQRRTSQMGGRLALAGVSEDLHNVFKVCGLATIFDFKPNVNAALAKFKKEII